MPTLLSLTKKRDLARKALASAATPKLRAKAGSELEAATAALARFNAKLEAKSTARLRAADDADEEEDEDEEADEAADDEPKKPMTGKGKGKKAKAADDSDDSDDSDDDSDGDSDEDDDAEEDESEDEDEDEEEDEDEDEEEDEEEDEDEEARAKALATARSIVRTAKKGGNKALAESARAHLVSVKRAVAPKAVSKLHALRSVCERVTGKKSLAAVIGALEALPARKAADKRLTAKVARLEQRDRAAKVDSLLGKFRSSYGKDEKNGLRADGMRLGTKWLRAHLEARPKLVRSVADGGFQGRTSTGSKDGDTVRAGILDAQNLSADQRKMIESMASGTGKTFDDFLAEMNKANAAAARR
jgi:hypothetical protein